MPETLLYAGKQRLSYAEYGDPGGFPILIHHGMIASIHEQGLFQRLAAAGSRLIALARPGYGGSSPYPLKNVAEWGEITAALVEALGLAQFDLLGISSGAPYCYAAARRLHQKTRRLFILSGTPALYDGQVRAMWPYPLNQGASLPELQTLAYDLFFAHLTPTERQAHPARDAMAHDCFGPALDLQIRAADWGFDLAQVTAPVEMRHSRADESVPLAAAQRTAHLLPRCRLDVREHDPHFSPQVLDDFIATAVLGTGSAQAG